MNKISKKNKKPTAKVPKNSRYEFIEHTADVKFKAYGKNFEEALINTGKAAVEVMTDLKKIKIKQKKNIKIEAKTKESLVYDFLEELIFLIDTEGFLVKEIKKMKVEKEKSKTAKEKFILSAILEGDNAKDYDIHTQIKSATYSDMNIEEKKGKCTIQVVLDI
jgi:SHS2 domain-containing protein